MEKENDEVEKENNEVETYKVEKENDEVETWWRKRIIRRGGEGE